MAEYKKKPSDSHKQDSGLPDSVNQSPELELSSSASNKHSYNRWLILPAFLAVAAFGGTFLYHASRANNVYTKSPTGEKYMIQGDTVEILGYRNSALDAKAYNAYKKLEEQFGIEFNTDSAREYEVREKYLKRIIAKAIYTDLNGTKTSMDVVFVCIPKDATASPTDQEALESAFLLDNVQNGDSVNTLGIERNSYPDFVAAEVCAKYLK